MSAEKQHIAALSTPLAALVMVAMFPADAEGAAAFGKAVISGDWALVTTWVTAAAEPVAQSVTDTYQRLGCALHGAGEAARSLWAMVI